MEVAGAHVVFHKMVATPGKHQIQGVLLYKRTQDAPIQPGYWGLIGGSVRRGEDATVALLREIKEELEVPEFQPPEFLCDVSIMRDGVTKFIRYFKAHLGHDMDSLRLKRNQEDNKVEGEGLGWFTQEEIHHLWVRPEDRVALTRFFGV